MSERDAVIGGGIIGLALALALARRGRRVTLFEAGPFAAGASLRNFGTLWPIGQPAGERRDLALESLARWREVVAQAGLWSRAAGSMHLAYRDDERRVLEEFREEAARGGFSCDLLDAATTIERSPSIRREGLLGSLFSPHELQVNSRQALVQLTAFLRERWNVATEFGARVTSCTAGVVCAGRRTWHADRVWLAPGDDLQTLYPDTFVTLGLQRCKLQMMRTAPVPWSVGPILAAGLTLGHYESFRACPSLPALQERLASEWPRHVASGIHVLVAQHDHGHLVIGDSHVYDGAITPFDDPAIDALVLQYLQTMIAAPSLTIVERWHGIYVKHQRPYVVVSPEPGVTALVALGGHGMTLSFGLAERVVREALA